MLYGISSKNVQVRLTFFASRVNPSAAGDDQTYERGFDKRGFDDEETKMRRTVVALSTAAALIAGPLVLGSTRAEAMVTAPQLGRAGQSINPIEKTACWRWGWRGWGWYPCGYYYGGYGYGPGYYPGYYGGYWGPRWGWGHRWGGGGWGHHRW
jgi:hypothetical protein